MKVSKEEIKQIIESILREKDADTTFGDFDFPTDSDKPVKSIPSAKEKAYDTSVPEFGKGSQVRISSEWAKDLWATVSPRLTEIDGTFLGKHKVNNRYGIVKWELPEDDRISEGLFKAFNLSVIPLKALKGS